MKRRGSFTDSRTPNSLNNFKLSSWLEFIEDSPATIMALHWLAVVTHSDGSWEICSLRGLGNEEGHREVIVNFF